MEVSQLRNDSRAARVRNTHYEGYAEKTAKYLVVMQSKRTYILYLLVNSVRWSIFIYDLLLQT